MKFEIKSKLKKTAVFLLAVCFGLWPNFSGFLKIAPITEVSAANGESVAGGGELRGVWIATVQNINFPSKAGLTADQMKAEIDDIIKTCKEANLNAIFFQVRPASDAMYNSAIFPVSKYLTGIQGNPLPGGFDPLAYITGEAHANNIEVHAWVNPYRITAGSAGSPEHDLSALAENNPARKNPSWTVKYPDGKLYYNPGLPEVRRLIVDGVIEIVKNYEIDGIHFDDYFYPYPVSGASFPDEAAYSKYGAGYGSVDDFRRANVNKLILETYNAIKETDPRVRFGISPFGIWANKSAKTPAGSDTGGFEAYYSLYADAKAWIEGGYIDYICPQIYWSFDTSVARFDILVRWWSAVVDGTGVDLYIGHAAYKVPSDFKSELELPRQVEYGRAYMGVSGSVFYGYKDIAANAYKIKDSLANLFDSPRKTAVPVNNGKGVEIGRPLSGATVSDASVNIMGSSNPKFPVYYNGQKLARTKSGFFTVYAALKDGKNNIEFKTNDTIYTHIITKASRAAAAPAARAQSDSYKIEILKPSGDIITNPGDKISISVQAPSKSEVTARLGNITVKLMPTYKEPPPDEGAYMSALYEGEIELPKTEPQGELINLGNIAFEAKRNGETADAFGINIKLINASAYRPIEVIKDYTPFKKAYDSDSYDDYMYASAGMRDNVVGFKNGYYKLGCGGYIPAVNAFLLPEKTLLVNRILSAAMENMGKVTEIRFAVAENVPVDAVCRDGIFRVTLFNSPEGAPPFTSCENPIFKSSVKTSSDKAKQTAVYSFELIHPDNWYGFEVVYEGGFIVLKVKNPMAKKEDDNKPLAGLTVAIDAGHGGTDPGSLGYMQNKNEKDLNLDFALALSLKLESMGASTVLTRTNDITLTIAQRMEIFNGIDPDFMISIHHNSVTDAQDNSRVRGFETRYTNDSGRLLAKSLSKTVASQLHRVERVTKYQALGVLRNHKFPAALLEMAFITNPDEYEFAAGAEGAKLSADAIAAGILAWIDDQQKWVK